MLKNASENNQQNGEWALAAMKINVGESWRHISINERKSQ